MVKYADVISHAQKNFQTAIGSKYSQEDVSEVWTQVSSFIKSSLLLKRAVDVKGLGRFTLLQYQLPVSSTYAIWNHRPLFYLEKTLCSSYNIKCVRLYSSDKISVVGLNLTAIAALANVTRQAAEDIVSEVVQSFRLLCMEMKDLELRLPTLGVLRIVNRVVDMRYCRDVVKEVHRDITEPVVVASHVGACVKRKVPAPTLLAPQAVPDRYLRDLHPVNYG